MAYTNNLSSGERAERKLLLTVVELPDGTTRELVGRRTEDSSIEFNPDIEQTTDILGINYADINKTQPQQTIDPCYIMGAVSPLGDYLAENIVANNITAFSSCFNVYIIEGWMTETTSGETPTTKYKTVKHSNCSIIPSSIGGDAYVSMPFDIYMSNEITEGSVNELSPDFEFTAD